MNFNKLLTNTNTIITINLLTIFFAFFIIINYLKFDVLEGHCLEYVFEELNDLLYCGRLLSGITNYFFYTILPNLININPNDLQNSIIAFFKSIIIIVKTLLITKLFFISYSNKKNSVLKEKIFTPIFIIIFCFIFNTYGVPEMHILSFLSDSAVFFDYCLSAVIFISFLIFLLKNFDEKEKKSKFYHILNITTIFALGITQEYFILMGFLILSYMLLIFLLKKKFNLLYSLEISNFSKKNIIYSYIALLLGMSIFLSVSNYTSFQNVGGGHNIDWITQFNSLNIKLVPFLKEYWEFGILPYIPLLFCISIPLFRKEYPRIKLIILLTLISVFTIDPLFLLIGKSEENHFFIAYHSIIYCRFLMFIILFFLSLGNTIEIFKTNKTNKKNIFILIISLFILFCYTYKMIDNIKNNYQKVLNTYNNIRHKYILCDNIATKIGYHTDVIILPISIYTGLSTHVNYYMSKHEKENYFLKKIEREEVENKQSRLFIQDNFCNFDGERDYANMYFSYIKNVYNFYPKIIIYVEDSLLEDMFKPFIDLNNINVKKFPKINKSISIEEINEKLKKYPNNYLLYLQRAKKHKEEKKYQKAIEDYTKAIQYDENYKLGYYLRGILYREMGELELAEKDIERTAKKHPKSIFLKYNLAKLMIKNKKYQKAIDIYSELIKIYPYSVNVQIKDFYFLRGLIYKENLNNYEKALDDFLSSKKINYLSNFAEVNKHIGDCYFELKNYENAKKYYKKELEYNDNKELYSKIDEI